MRARVALVGLLGLIAASVGSAQEQTPPVPRLAPVARFTIVVDAAHGGDDAGGKVGNQAEKDLTLAVSVRLRSLLGARGFQVVTTRESDAAVEPERRAEIANHAGAQACISIHATESGAGVHLFVSSLAPAQPGRFTAWKTAQAASVTRSLALAGVMNASLLHAGLPVTLGRMGLGAVESMSCPAVAVEIAPDRSQDPVVLPNDEDYQAKIAEALAAALLEWKAEARQP